MKRTIFIRELVNSGCYLKRHGKKHDIYANPHNGKQAPIPFSPPLEEVVVPNEEDIMNAVAKVMN